MIIVVCNHAKTCLDATCNHKQPHAYDGLRCSPFKCNVLGRAAWAKCMISTQEGKGNEK